MRILLDTHIILWSLADSPQLSDKAREIILNPKNEIYYSVLSMWELEIKRLTHPDQIAFTSDMIKELCEQAGYNELYLNYMSIMFLENVYKCGNKLNHKDPFDQMLICQAIAKDMKLLTHDRNIVQYPKFSSGLFSLEKYIIAV